MPLDTVPWAVKGGAVISAEVARSFAYAATSGASGVTQPSDLQVRSQTTPGSTVRVASGVAAIVNTYAGQFGQSYIVRNAGEEDVTISATVGTARSDMLVLRIDDPQYGGSTPPNVASGPYAKFAIISNVGSSAVAPPAGIAFPCIPLARIDIPANTGAIAQSMIFDLRPKLDYQPVSESKNVVVVTNAQGRQTINFAKTFPTPPVVTASGGNGEVYWIVGVTTTGFTVEARFHGKDILIQGSVRVLYHAVESH